MNAKDYIAMRIRKSTQQKLKIVAALSHESMLDTVERLVSHELDRLQKRKGSEDEANTED